MEGTRYEEVAERIRAMIRAGTFRPGDRIPSVRELHTQWSVSKSTVLEAYRRLENEGLILSRPQSGYYVKLSSGSPTKAHRKPALASLPPDFNREDLIYSVYTAGRSVNVVNLAQATPDDSMLPLNRLNPLYSKVSRDDPHGASHYEALGGYRPLKEQISRRMIAAGCTTDPNDVIITSGCQEALSLCLRALCKRGDLVVVESPTFYGILIAVKYAGLRPLEVSMTDEGIDLDELEGVLQHQRVGAILVMSNHQNPLGCRMPDAKKRQLVEIAERYNTPVIEDDIYGDLSYELTTERPRALQSFDQRGLVVYCSSFSKSIAPGLRVGWVASKRYAKEIERQKAAMSYSTATLPQRVIAELLSSGGYDQLLRRSRRHYAKSMAHNIEMVANAFPAGTVWSRPAGGYVMWIQVPEGVDTFALYPRALERGVHYAPGAVFTDRTSGSQFLRINAGMTSERIDNAIRRLGAIIAESLES